jgi:hypothetical protein
MRRVFLPLRLVLALLLPLSLLCAAAPAFAQLKPPDQSTPEQEDIDAREQLVWHPSYGLTSLGYDSNVFNLPSANNGNTKLGDWIATFAAGLAPIWNVGDVRVSADTGLVYNYFQQFTQERGLDGNARGRIDIPVSRVRLHVGGGYANRRQRVNYEIDERARRTEEDVNAGFDVAIGGRTTLGLSARRGRVRFADDLDHPETLTLRETLNRDERTATASVAYAITPFTSFVATGDLGTHVFQLSPGRDGHTAGYSGGLMLTQDAVINGQASVGWRRVTVSNPLIPAYTGLAYDIDLSTVLGEATRVGVRGRRDVSFSSDVQSPYYVQSSIGTSLKQIIGDGWEVGVRGERVWLDYARSSIETSPAYSETVDVVGGSFGYRFPGGFRLALEVESQRRRSSSHAPGRAYNTLRTYTVISKSIGKS